MANAKGIIMKSLDLSKLDVFSPRLDWLSVTGDVSHINREEDIEAINYFFESIGFQQMKNKQRPVFRSSEMGIEVSFGKKKTDQTIFLKIEFQGQFFAESLENTEATLKTFINLVWEKFGVESPPKATRIDIATDIVGVTHKEIFPDLSKKRYDILGNSTRSPQVTLSRYNSDKNDLKKETGIQIWNNRFEFCLYNRLIRLKDYKEEPHKKWYVNYYNKQYEGSDLVTRIEVRLKKNLCDYFNTAFFLARESLKDCLNKSLAHFNRHHRFLDRKKNEYIKHIDQLFFREEYETIKTLKLKNNIEADLKDLCYSRPFVNLNAPTKLLTRVMVANNLTSNEDILDVAKKIKSGFVKEAISVNRKLKEHKKTLEIFNFDSQRQLEIAHSFKKESRHFNKIIRENSNEGSIRELEIRLLGSLTVQDLKNKITKNLETKKKGCSNDESNSESCAS